MRAQAAVLASALCLAALPVHAQSSSPLGFSWAEAEIGLSSFRSDDPRGFARLTGDFAVTEALGFQLDLSLRDFSGGMLGQIDSHLYLMPGDRNKYGLFLSLADVDGREATIGMAGVEGIFAITETTRIGARGGIGYARPGSIDFIAASLGVDHDLGPRDTLFATLSVSEFDEVSLRGQGYDAEIGWRHALASHPVELTAAVGVSGMSGRDDLPSETRVSLGLTWRFGAEPGRSRTTATQAFRPVRPFDPLLLTGSF